VGTNGDGTVNYSSEYKYSNFGLDNYSDLSIKQGKVVAVYGPGDKKNISKKFVEYTVVASSQINLTTVPVTYFQCRTASLFGGVADFSRWTPRLTKDDAKYVTGSLVMLLCVKGDRRDAYIIGGFPNPGDTEKDSPPSEFPYYEFEFNGINLEINKLGELTLFRRGPTNDDASVKDDKGEGFTFKLTNDGNAYFGQKDETVGFTLDKTNKIYKLVAKGDIQSETDGEFKITTLAGVRINPKGLGRRQAFVSGTFYREQEEILHVKLQGQLTQLNIALASLGTAVGTAGTGLTAAGLAMIPPVVVLHSLANIPIQAAGGALAGAAVTIAGMAAVVLQMQEAIASFEMLKSAYLSIRHDFLD
jgi:hypothetical protein